jgi:hypothetical protein
LSKLSLGATVAGALAAAVLLMSTVVSSEENRAQPTTIIGVDADPAGNTATSLGVIESCASVAAGDTFEVNVFVKDVVDLLAWEAYFVYDGNIVSIVDHDVKMFQAANPGSNILDISENLPDLDGQYRLSGADISDPPAPDSGSGVLASLTLLAIKPGISPARLATADVTGDGTADLGPFLRNVGGDPILDEDGDGIFDGQVFDAEIAVDTDCPPDMAVLTPGPASVSPSPRPTTSPTVRPVPATVIASPTPAETPPNEDEDSTWTGRPWIIGYVIAGVVVLLAGVALTAVMRRRAG